MLDLEELQSARQKSSEQQPTSNPSVFVQPAMAAVQELAERNPDADLSLVVEALQSLASADAGELDKAQIPSRAATEAQRVLQLLKDRAAERVSN
jgi:hypothetical protein